MTVWRSGKQEIAIMFRCWTKYPSTAKGESLGTCLGSGLVVVQQMSTPTRLSLGNWYWFLVHTEGVPNPMWIPGFPVRVLSAPVPSPAAVLFDSLDWLNVCHREEKQNGKDSTTWSWIVLEWLEGGKCLPLFTPPAIAPEPDCYRFSAKVYLQFRQLRDISRQTFGPLLQPWHIKQWLRAAI